MKQIRVLFVDDNSDHRKLFELHARSMMGGALRLQEAPSAYAGMEVLRKSFPLPHVVIVDLNLGVADADGHSLTRDIRADSQFASIPVFTVSRSPEVADYEKDAEGEWLPKLCGAVIHAAASYKPGTLDLLHAGQEAHAVQLHTHTTRLDGFEGRLDVAEASIEEGKEVVGGIQIHMDSQHKELLTAIRKRSRVSLGVVAILCTTVVFLGVLLLARDIATRMDVRSLDTQFKDLRVNVNGEAGSEVPIEASIESDGTDYAEAAYTDTNMPGVLQP